MKVVKRDGTIVDYDRSKIVTAIEKANAEVPPEEQLDRARIDAIIDHIGASSASGCWWRTSRTWWSRGWWRSQVPPGQDLHHLPL